MNNTTAALVNIPGFRTLAGGRKEWAKIVTGVDDTKNDGFAFDGKFVDLGRNVPIAEGSLVLVHLSGGNFTLDNGEKVSMVVRLYRVKGGELVKLNAWGIERDTEAAWAAVVKPAVVDALADVDALEQRRERLLAELAELDARIAELRD